MASHLAVTKKIYLSAAKPSDIPTLVRHLNDPQIYCHTLYIPYPYTKKDGKEFLSFVRSKKKRFGCLLDWAIRTGNGKLIGMIGFHGSGKRNGRKCDQIGYWLARPYWRRGIMTDVLKKFVAYGFSHRGYESFEMPIFVFNKASIRVAQKAGFRREKLVKKAFKKNGVWLDAYVYVITRE